MLSLVLRLWLSDVARHRAKTLLAVAGVAAGVATFLSMGAAEQALRASVDDSVDRLAGHLDLEVSALGGISEVQDALRALPQIATARPVIEQVIAPADRQLGSLLIVAIDLAFDQRALSSTARAGLQLDDPLVFLAQADSIALTREFAARAHVTEGDALVAFAAGVRRTFQVRALLPAGYGRAYGGNVAVMDVFAAQTVFGRGRRFDRIEVSLAPGISLDAGAAVIRASLREGVRVEPSDRRGAELKRRVTAIVRGFDVITILAFAIGVLLVSNVLSIAVDRRRRDIATLRAVGGTPGQVLLWFLSEAAIIGIAGGLLGVVISEMSTRLAFGFLDTVIQATQSLSNTPIAVTPRASPALSGLLVGVAASLVGAWLPARRAARARPVDVFAVGVHSVSRETTPAAQALTGLLLLPFGWLLQFGPDVVAGFSYGVGLLGAAFVGVAILGRGAAVLARGLARVIGRVGGAAGHVAADALRQPRRTSATVTTLAMSAAFALGTGGFLAATRTSFDGWIDGIMTADVVVRASYGWGPSTVHLPYDVRDTLMSLDHVSAIDAVRTERIDVRDTPVTLTIVESRQYGRRARHRFVAGNAGAFEHALPDGHACIVSEPFATRLGVAIGDAVTFDLPDGAVTANVAAIVDGDRRTVIIDRTMFVAGGGPDTVDAFHIVLDSPDAATSVRDAISRRLDANTPALVTARREFADEMHRVMETGVRVTHATFGMAVFVALLGVTIAQLLVASERRRDVAVLRAIGATPAQIAGATALEAVSLSVVSVAIALPAGALIGWLIATRVADSVAGFHFAWQFPTTAALIFAVTLPVICALAAWMPVQWNLAQRIARTIAP